VDYEKVLDKIPYAVIEEHLKRRREDNRDYLRFKWAVE